MNANITTAPDGEYLSPMQVEILLKPIHPRRVAIRQGMSYVEGYDIRAELNRVFGFGRWSTAILDQTLIADDAIEMNNKKPGWYVVYRTTLRLTVRLPSGDVLAEYEESHVGESTHPVRGEAHGNALTNSTTYALKRCAINLGDQFGLSLYGKGSMDALVRWTLVRPDTGEAKVDTDDVAQVVPEGEQAGAGKERPTGVIAESGHPGEPKTLDSPPPPAAPARVVRSANRRPPLPPPTETDGVDQEATAEYITAVAEANDVAALRKIYDHAKTEGKLNAVVIRPDLTTGPLHAYITEVKKALLKNAPGEKAAA